MDFYIHSIFVVPSNYQKPCLFVPFEACASATIDIGLEVAFYLKLESLSSDKK